MEINKLKAETSRKKVVWEAYFKKNRKNLEKMDQQILNFHDEVSAKTDCLSCGNCCRTLGPRILDKDIEKMAKAVRMKQSDFFTQYLREDEDGDMVFQSMPCPFLGDDNYCAIYDARPKACREYPHTDRKKFYQIYKLSVKNAETCPIVFEVLEKIVDC
jgi:Fe-S-cluster containining protein